MWKKIFNYFLKKMDNPSFQTSFKLEKIFPVFFNGINYSGNKSDFLILILSACGIHPICLYLSHHKSVKRQIQYFIAFVFFLLKSGTFVGILWKKKKRIDIHACGYYFTMHHMLRCFRSYLFIIWNSGYVTSNIQILYLKSKTKD